jgi:hypothetical protein
MLLAGWHGQVELDLFAELKAAAIVPAFFAE